MQPYYTVTVRNVKKLLKVRNDAILAKTRCQIDLTLKSIELDIMSQALCLMVRVFIIVADLHTRDIFPQI